LPGLPEDVYTVDTCPATTRALNPNHLKRVFSTSKKGEITFSLAAVSGYFSSKIIYEQKV
jgi:hypothetical protein